MQKKKDFENNLKAEVQSNAELNEKYGSLWTDIENGMIEMEKLTSEQSALSYDSFDSPDYFSIASQLIPIAIEYELSKSDTSFIYTDEDLKESIDLLIPDDFDSDKE